MEDEESNSNTPEMGGLSKAYTTGALEALMTQNKKINCASRGLEEKRERLTSFRPSQVDSPVEKLSRIKGLVNERQGSQFEEVYAYQINGDLCFVEHPEDMIEQFEMPEEVLADLKEMGDEYTGDDLIIRRLELDEIEQALQAELTNQKDLIRSMSRELSGAELKDIYVYRVNDVLSLDESLEAMANRLGIPEEMRADLKDVGYLCHGTTSAGEDIAIWRVGLEEAIRELTEQIFPSLWDNIKELENELSGVFIQSEDVYTYKVNDVLRIVESPEALAQSLGLPEAEQAALKEVDDEYHSRDSRGRALTIKCVGLYDARDELAEQVFSQRQLIKELATEFYGTVLKEVYPYHVTAEFVVPGNPLPLAKP